MSRFGQMLRARGAALLRATAALALAVTASGCNTAGSTPAATLPQFSLQPSPTATHPTYTLPPTPPVRQGSIVLPQTLVGQQQVPSPALAALITQQQQAVGSSDPSARVDGAVYGAGTPPAYILVVGYYTTHGITNPTAQLSAFAGGFTSADTSITLSSATQITLRGVTYYCWAPVTNGRRFGLCAWVDARALGAIFDFNTPVTATVAALADTARVLYER